jgi:hypothetical protein
MAQEELPRFSIGSSKEDFKVPFIALKIGLKTKILRSASFKELLDMFASTE